jgi:predicted nucleic-acid-binding protein
MSPRKNPKIHLFLDANIIIRFLVRDDERKAEHVKELFLLLEAGKISAETDMIVIAEIVWVLSSFYKLDRETIAEYISLFLATKYLVVKEKPLVQKAIELYKKVNVDFIDCFVAVTANKRKAVVCSYDKDFNKFEGVERIEPEDILKKFSA